GKRTKETGTNQDKQRANSKDEDPTGLLNEGFRYRDIETGVWLSRDPAGFVDGPNLYAYVQQNPWTSFDPDGLFLSAAVEKLDEKFLTPVGEAIGKGIASMMPSKTLENLTQDNKAFAMAGTALKGVKGASMTALNTLSPFDDAAKAALNGDIKGALAEGGKEILGGKFAKAGGKVLKLGGEALGSLAKKSDNLCASAQKNAAAATALADDAAKGGGWKPTPFNQCFPAGTMVLMADGTSKPIEAIAEGDEVLADDPEDSSPPCPKQVTHLHRNWTQRFIHVAVDTDNDGTADSEVCATGEHPFWTVSRGWVAAKDLSLGDALQTPWGDTPRVVSATSIPEVSDTYNLTVQGAHTFFALVGNTPILVHNTEPFDIVPFGSFDRPLNLSSGVPFQRHELLQNAWLKHNGYLDFKALNPSLATPTTFHQQVIFGEQAAAGLHNPSLLKGMSAYDNIRGNIAVLKASGVDRSVIADLANQARNFAKSLPCP
ncbi:MAG: hypothetical protein IAE77_14155, partial [Prosthecobacter sp.]|uniref:polymorphic toxin-type HINT domain-containing protein n=1 Tax=Prosthecobacter sp. TaxID=1965333 RepID=UPI0019F6FC05